MARNESEVALIKRLLQTFRTERTIQNNTWGKVRKEMLRHDCGEGRIKDWDAGNVAVLCTMDKMIFYLERVEQEVLGNA
jgi:hypothetical protein